jgi:WD40 repeat protein
VALSSNHEEVHSVSYDGSLKSVNMEKQKKTRSVNITSSKLTCCQLHHSEKFLTIGSFDSKLFAPLPLHHHALHFAFSDQKKKMCKRYVYSFEHSKVVAKVEEAHESSVSTMRLKKNLLLTGSTDSTVKLWDIDNIGAGQLLRYEYHHAPASSCDLSEACNIATVGFSDGTVSLFDVRAGLKTISSKVFFFFFFFFFFSRLLTSFVCFIPPKKNCFMGV